MGQLNFYINVVDDTLRGEHDNKTIGMLLCNGGDKVVAQYALSGYDQAIGVSDYQLSKAYSRTAQVSFSIDRRGRGRAEQDYR